MTRRVLTGKSWPGRLYPRGLADFRRLDPTFADEAERLTVRRFEAHFLTFPSPRKHGLCRCRQRSGSARTTGSSAIPHGTQADPVRRRSVDREKAKARIRFLGQPMGRALHAK